MNFTTTVFFVYCFILKFVVSNDPVEQIAYVVNSLAKFFSANCVYFLTSSSTNDITNQRLASLVSTRFAKPLSFFNFSAYYNLLEKGSKEQCQVPLRVILQFGDTTISNDFLAFNSLYTNHSDKMHSGAWIVFMKSFEDDYISKFFRKIHLPFDIEIIVAWIHKEEVHLKEVYQVTPSHIVKQPYFGNCSFKTGLNISRTSLYSRRSDLEGLKLKVGYIEENLPFTMTGNTGKENYIEGYFGEIWRALEALINISSTYTKVDLKMEKEENANSWLRIMKMLRENKIDVGLSDFVLSTSRLDYLDFSYPLLASNFQVFGKNPPNDRHFHSYLLPFAKDIWYSLFIWSIINALCTSYFAFLSRRFTQNSETIMNVLTSYFMTFGGLCGQGFSNVQKLSSCKLLFLFNYIISAIIIPSYSASLTRYLTSKPSEVILKNLNELHDAGFHRILVVDGSYEFFSFQNLSRDNENLGKIFRKDVKNKNLPRSYKEALLLTCNEKNVGFFAVTSRLIWEMNKAENVKLSDCELRKIMHYERMLSVGIIYPKNSRFKGLIDYHLRNLQKTGVINRLQRKYWTAHPKLHKKGWESVSLENSSALFHVIVCGAILSSIIVILEKIPKKSATKTCK